MGFAMAMYLLSAAAINAGSAGLPSRMPITVNYTPYTCVVDTGVDHTAHSFRPRVVPKDWSIYGGTFKP